MQNNPAARLYNLARRLRSTSGNGPPVKLWAQALDIPINQEMTGPPFFQVVQEILAFLNLINETKTCLHELEFDDFYSEAFPPLMQVVEVSLSNLRTSRSNLTRPLTDETLTLLRVIAAELSKRKPDPKIDEERLKEIQSEAHDLFESVKRADIDGDLKRLILSLTAEIEQAIQQYRIGGPEGLKRALDFIVGQAKSNIDLIGKANDDEGARISWNRFSKIAVKFSEIVKFASDAGKMIEVISPFVRLIGGAPGETPPLDLDGPGKQ